MVYLIRPLAMHEEPCEPVGVVLDAINPDGPIAAITLYSPCDITDTDAPACGLPPYELAGNRIVIKQLLKSS